MIVDQTFSAFENGNATISVTQATPEEFLIQLFTRDPLGVNPSRSANAYADMRELIDLRNKLTELIRDSYDAVPTSL